MSENHPFSRSPGMRGKPDYQSQIYYPIDIESWIVADHPLRAVKRRADEVLSAMRRDFEKAYARYCQLESGVDRIR